MNSHSPQVSTSSHSSSVAGSGGGCLKCGKDDDHHCLLLCEWCNDEYHIYCLNPPLSSVPEEAFFCSDACKHAHKFSMNKDRNDELEQRVDALSPAFTQRFGEIIWAYGGQGFGWWPSCIYDPRLTTGEARKLALKNIGKKHLVYFFGCSSSPYTVLPDNKCMNWNDGLMEQLDTGKVAKAVSKNRAMMFEWALQVATAENDKPIELRMDWNHEEDPLIVAGGNVTKAQNQVNTTKESSNDNKKRQSNDKKRHVDTNRKGNRNVKSSSLLEQNEANQKKKKNKTKHISLTSGKTNRQSFNNVIMEYQNANRIVDSYDAEHDDQLFCKILRKIKNENENDMHDVNIGFITLSKTMSTFADARKKIIEDFDDDDDLMSRKWKFYIPHLGPMSEKQETSFGSVYNMLMKNGDGRVGNGTSRHPLKVIIYEC